MTTTDLPLITDEWTHGDVKAGAVSNMLSDELLWADIILIGSRMYNLTISSSLKAWIDQVVRASKTFSYGATGPLRDCCPPRRK